MRVELNLLVMIFELNLVELKFRVIVLHFFKVNWILIVNDDNWMLSGFLWYKVEPNQEFQGLVCEGANVIPAKFLENSFRNGYGNLFLSLLMYAHVASVHSLFSNLRGKLRRESYQFEAIGWSNIFH